MIQKLFSKVALKNNNSAMSQLVFSVQERWRVLLALMTTNKYSSIHRYFCMATLFFLDGESQTLNSKQGYGDHTIVDGPMIWAALAEMYWLLKRGLSSAGEAVEGG